MQDPFLFFFLNQKGHLAFIPYLMKGLSVKTGVQVWFLHDLESEREPQCAEVPYTYLQLD